MTDGAVFDRAFDVVIFGGGYAGYSAARALAESGKDALVVDWGGDLLWESSRAYHQDVRGSTDQGFLRFIDELRRVDGTDGNWIDGAITELLANEGTMRGRPEVLYFAAPVGISLQDDMLASVAVATKQGVQRLVAGQWIDATESGSLITLLDGSTAGAEPAIRRVHLYLQQRIWPEDTPATITLPNGETLCCERTLWPNQLRLSLSVAADRQPWRGQLVPALRAFRAEVGQAAVNAFVSHVSVMPYSEYDGQGHGLPHLPENVATAVPALSSSPVRSLEDRWRLGASAAKTLGARPSSSASITGQPAMIPDRDAIALERCQVAVVGAGTGGAMAAIAAGRQGADTVVVEPLGFAGGVGTGGGIHSYYWGFPGGLQQEVDERAMDAAAIFAPSGTYGGFHPEAKKLVLDQMMMEAGVRFWGESMLYGVDVQAGTVRSGAVVTPGGPRRVEAHSWVDATGNGDLSAWAGASYQLGRSVDGNLHAYSQSCSYIGEEEGLVKKMGSNFDAGYVDPTDSEDMTRARITGLHQYFVLPFEPTRRPAAMSPLLGLRQGRQIKTDYVLTLDDLIERRRFPDSVGYTGSAYDNHAVDYEFESRDTMFMVWGCQLYYISTACEIPYRMLLPQGLDNVWLGSRALGVSEEAHHSMRMQRDMQRVGEVAGIAAALAAATGCVSREVKYKRLRKALETTGAFELRDKMWRSVGKNQMLEQDFQVPLVDLPPSERVKRAYEGLVAGSGSMGVFKNQGQTVERPEVGLDLWYIYRYGRETHREKMVSLLESANDDLVWQAAMVLAGWGDRAAEPRLIQAVLAVEVDSGFQSAVADAKKSYNVKKVPRWWAAASFLGFCGTRAALAPLAGLSAEKDLPLNARNVIALSLEKIAARSQLRAEDRDLIERALEDLTRTEAPVAVGSPNRNPFTGEEDFRKQTTNRRIANRVEEDFTWQVQYTAARLRRALGLPLGEIAARLAHDRRALVRRAFQGLR